MGRRADFDERSIAPFCAAAQAAIDSIVFADANGLITYANPAAERLLGYAPGELVGAPLTALMPERFRSAHEEGFARHLATGERRVIGRTVELTAQRRDGGSFPIELSISAGDASGRPFFTAIIRDITRRRAAESALARSEALLAQAMQLAGVGTWEWHIDQDVVTWSDELYRTFGVDPRSFPASYGAYLDYVHPADRERIDGIVRDALVEASAFGFEHRIVRPDGSERTLSCRGVVVVGEDGRPLRMLGIAQDVTERKRLEDQLRHLADHDSLTGLINRRRFEEELERYAAYAQRYGRGGAVLLIDLDSLKHVNDTLGHGAGDAVITAVARAVKARLRASDVVARLGGDEFAVLLPELNASDARVVAESLRAAIAACPISFAGERLRTTASIGIALVDADTGSQLLAHSDIAMYAAKSAGRDRVALYESPDAATISGR